MNSEAFKRKLTTILSADVAGYGRLMSEDEPSTVLTMTHAEKGAQIYNERKK